MGFIHRHITVYMFVNASLNSSGLLHLLIWPMLLSQATYSVFTVNILSVRVFPGIELTTFALPTQRFANRATGTQSYCLCDGLFWGSRAPLQPIR